LHHRRRQLSLSLGEPKEESNEPPGSPRATDCKWVDAAPGIHVRDFRKETNNMFHLCQKKKRKKKQYIKASQSSVPGMLWNYDNAKQGSTTLTA